MAAGGGDLFGIKTLSLMVLTVQNACVVLLMRYTRTLPGDLYFPSTAVMLTEILKLVTAGLVLLIENGNIIDWLKVLYTTTVSQPLDMAKMLVPACIYTVQNNLLYLAVSNLDAATYLVSYQLKIFTTALFSVAMLKKSISRVQWLSLFMLFVGVSAVQLQPTNGGKSQNVDDVLPTESLVAQKQNPLLGLSAVVASSICSGFAGVYFEKTLKGTRTALWARNVQLAIFGVIIGAAGIYINDGDKIKEKGLLYGYHGFVWVIIGMQAFGGLLVGVVVKYADNILKGFSAAVSIVVSSIASMYLFDFRASTPFLLGTGLVMAATYLYGMPQKAAQSSTLHASNGKEDKKTN